MLKAKKTSIKSSKAKPNRVDQLLNKLFKELDLFIEKYPKEDLKTSILEALLITSCITAEHMELNQIQLLELVAEISESFLPQAETSEEDDETCCFSEPLDLN